VLAFPSGAGEGGAGMRELGVGGCVVTLGKFCSGTGEGGGAGGLSPVTFDSSFVSLSMDKLQEMYLNFDKRPYLGIEK
jgi:hypothetical protein